MMLGDVNRYHLEPGMIGSVISEHEPVRWVFFLLFFRPIHLHIIMQLFLTFHSARSRRPNGYRVRIEDHGVFSVFDRGLMAVPEDDDDDTNWKWFFFFKRAQSSQNVFNDFFIRAVCTDTQIYSFLKLNDARRWWHTDQTNIHAYTRLGNPGLLLYKMQTFLPHRQS